MKPWVTLYYIIMGFIRLLCSGFRVLLMLREVTLRLLVLVCNLNAGGFEEFKLMERVGEGERPAVVIGEVADDMNLDLVVLSMESIHSKHIDSNLLAEFVPCPVLLLPL